MEMRFPSMPIVKSSLQVILFCWKLPTVTFFCLFVLHERPHSLSPSQVCHFPLLLLNASYSNGMFSEFPLFSSLQSMPSDIHTDPRLQAASVNHRITVAENRRVQNPINSDQAQCIDLIPGPSSLHRPGQTLRGSSVPTKTAVDEGRI